MSARDDSPTAPEDSRCSRLDAALGKLDALVARHPQLTTRARQERLEERLKSDATEGGSHDGSEEV